MISSGKEYKVIAQSWCLTPGAKARKIEHYLLLLAEEGWKFTALDSVLLLGIDIGFYLIVERDVTEAPKS